MNARIVLLAATILTTFAGVLQANPPNVVVMILDDVSPDDLGCYGHPHAKTPNLDAWAKTGLRFDAAFLTCSSCSPSRCSILTSRYPHATGAAELHQPLPANQVTLPGELKRGGYYTAAAGKWHLGPSARKDFDRIEDKGGGESGCDKWLAVLKERPAEKPFFLWLAAIDAHRDYKPGAIADRHGREDVVVPPFLPDSDVTRDDLALYQDEITRADGYLGQVLDELKRQGVYDETVVIFMADNGRPFPRCKTTVYDSGVRTPLIVSYPRKVAEGSTSERLISSIDLAPTLLELAGLSIPESFQGKSAAATLADPTKPVREYAFAEHNWHDYRAFERSVRDERWLYIANAVPELTGSPPADAVRSTTYQRMIELEQAGHLPPEQRGCFVAPRSAEELYDVVADPHQLDNLAGDPAHAETLAKLRAVQRKWAVETGDVPIENVDPEKLTPDEHDRLTGKLLEPKR